MMMLHKTNKLNQSQAGFASILIALILILVLAIITVGFVTITNREQQQSLDSYLATQANYAAETGINDVAHQLSVNPTNVSDQTSCTPPTGSPNSSFLDYSIGSNNLGTSYTCVLISHALPNLNYGGVTSGDGRSAIFSLNSLGSGSNLGSLTFSWTTQSATTEPAAGTGFTPFGSWSGQYPSVLQVDFVPLGAGTDRNSLLANVFHTFLYPTLGGGAQVTYSTAANNQGQVINAICSGSSPVKCSATICQGATGVTCSVGAGLKGPFLVHFISYYAKSDITITATDNGGSHADIYGAQVQVDVTGKARNVLKRIQVRVPVNATYPDYALQAQSICSRMQTAPGTSLSPNGTEFYDMTGGKITTGSGPCYPN